MKAVNTSDKITKGLKTKVSDVNDAKGIVTIQITQFDKRDSDNDRIMKGALTKTWNEGNQVHLVDHQRGLSTYIGLPIRKRPGNWHFGKQNKPEQTDRA